MFERRLVRPATSARLSEILRERMRTDERIKQGMQHGFELARTQALEWEIAERFGFPTFADYFADRRQRGWSLAQIAAEAGRDRRWVARAADRLERLVVMAQLGFT